MGLLYKWSESVSKEKAVSEIVTVNLFISQCYALAGALCTTCIKTKYCQVNYNLVGKVLGVQSIDIVQYSKALK